MTKEQYARHLNNESHLLKLMLLDAASGAHMMEQAVKQLNVIFSHMKSELDERYALMIEDCKNPDEYDFFADLTDKEAADYYNKWEEYCKRFKSVEEVYRDLDVLKHRLDSVDRRVGCIKSCMVGVSDE